MCGKLFFGLVRRQSEPLADIYGSGDPSYDIYFVNASGATVTLKEKSFGGFKTYDDMVAISTPKQEALNVIVEPQGYVLFSSLYEASGANQYQAVVETDEGIFTLTFYLDSEIGFMGTLIPCLNKLGRIIRPERTR